MAGPLDAAHAITKIPAQDLDRARRFYRDRERGLQFERVDVPQFAVEGDIVTVPGNYPSKGKGERGAFFRDSEGNLLALGQPSGLMTLPEDQ